MAKVKMRTEPEKKALIKRIKTIEGQVRGISKMIEEDRYCDDVLIQISAITKSLESLGKELLKNHLNTCIIKEIKNNERTSFDDLMDIIGRLN